MFCSPMPCRQGGKEVRIPANDSVRACRAGVDQLCLHEREEGTSARHEVARSAFATEFNLERNSAS